MKLDKSVTPEYFLRAKRVTVKVGSALLTDKNTGKLNTAWFESFIEDVAALKKFGKEVIIVSSGAVGLGRLALGLKKKSVRLEQKQAAAAVGQVALTRAYQEEFTKYKLIIGQILLTKDDTEVRKRYLNVRETADTLLTSGVIPLINENDAVSDLGFRYGDNDRLAARIASMSASDILILLSDIDGLYTANPSAEPSARHIPYVEEITRDIEEMAGDAVSEFGTGGMATKITAAKISINAGCAMIIADGKQNKPLSRIAAGEKHTFFAASSEELAARKLWIAGAPEVSGVIIVDNGAEIALKEGNSLLPSGVTAVQGEFTRGDCVGILNANEMEIARGLTVYSADEIDKIRGRHSNAILKTLGYTRRPEIIHRNDLVML